MPGIVALADDVAIVQFHTLGRIVHHEFLKPTSGQAYQRVLLTGLALMKEHQAQKWLSDDRNNALLSEDDEAWGVSVWTPQAIAAGWRYWAIVLPVTRLGMSDTQRLPAIDMDEGVTVRSFSDPDKALKWLEEVA